MSRLARVLVVAIAMTAALLGGAGRESRADTRTLYWNVKVCDAFGTVGDMASCNPAPDVTGPQDYVTYLKVQPEGGAPTEPLWDLAAEIFSANLGVAQGVSLPDGAFVGEVSLKFSTNYITSLAAQNNIDSVTGAPPSCGAPGTTTVSSATEPLYDGSVSPIANPIMTQPAFDESTYIQAFDDDDDDLVEFYTGVDANDGGDDVPETQEDTDPPNGVPDGADKMPDFLPRYLNSYGIAPLLQTRAYTSIGLAPGKRLDVHYIVLALTALGAGHIGLTLVGSEDPGPYSTAASQITPLICAPFESTMATYGVTRDNPLEPGSQAGVIARLFTAVTVDYVMGMSSEEDTDDDGLPARVDRCQVDASAAGDEPSDDTDADGVSGACDVVEGSADNCDGTPACGTAFGAAELGAACADAIDGDGDTLANDGCPAVAAQETGAQCGDGADSDFDGFVNDGCPAFAGIDGGTPDGSLCTGLTPAVGFEGGSAATRYPWDLDQDVDCDGTHNFWDNCPVSYNPRQLDIDGDGIGNRCDADPPGGPGINGCSGALISAPLYVPPCDITSSHDHDAHCNDLIVLHSSEPDGDATTCLYEDASDDSVLDFDAAHPNPGGNYDGQRDLNSDSDYDGCSDGAEGEAGATAGAQFCEGDPLDSDSDDDGVLDGYEDTGGPFTNFRGITCTDPDSTQDWRDDANCNGVEGINPNNYGSPDSDRDGCSNKEEGGTSSGLGGNRDALWPYDFPDIPLPAVGGVLTATAARNGSISLGDVLVLIAYSGTTTSTPKYNEDNNSDGVLDGLQLDRRPASDPMSLGHLAGPPSGAVSISDVLVVLSHVGANCTALP